MWLRYNLWGAATAAVWLLLLCSPRCTALMALGRRRPIITGCLAECGVEEQSCMTQCQVCVEEHGCRSVSDCGGCQLEARRMRQSFNSLDGVVGDSGGLPLSREGLRAQLLRARLEALDATRKLRHVRGEVLQGQRQVEWTVEERQEETMRLREADSLLKKAQAEASQWSRRSEEKLNATREEAEERSAEVMRTERQLSEARVRLHRARQQLHGSGEQTSTLRDLALARDVVRRLRLRVKDQYRKRKRAQRVLRENLRDAEWVKKGLHKEVQRAKEGLKAVAKELRIVREMEALHRQQLENAKAHYRETAAASQRSEGEAAHLEMKLKKTPLPIFDKKAAAVQLAPLTEAAT
mmetsp:Transcript_47717/g.102261  ORF Transcript_47717/g.102261 Transcript_47717/m.102261 type:complete len:352 (+) Transcript_47717:231-1286(+)